MSDQSEQPDAGDDTQGVAVDAVTDGVAGTVHIDGREAPVTLSDEIVEAVEDADGVTLADIAQAAAPPADSDFAINAHTDAGDTATIPVQDVHDHDLTRSGLERHTRFNFIQDDRIAKLENNSVTYSDRVGEWILTKDDLVPAIKERIKALIMGEDGLSVDPSDPDNDADQKLADHQQDIYDNDVRPTKVVDTILDENMKNSRAVLRSTDLKPLDLGDLDYVRDGETGDEIYLQHDTEVQTFELDDGDVDLEKVDVPAQPLVIGEHVFDVELYDKPPLEAVADTVVNKKQMQKLKARKAEITSFGGIYVKVNPPEYLPEEDYFDRVEDGDGNEVTKLERALNKNLDNAFEWAKGYQSGTTGAVPMHWDVEQVSIPENNEPLDDQIRGYNKDISRRLLMPIDVMELREGSELSRQTLMEAVLSTIKGWRQEVLRVFDEFAQVQAEIHDLNGSVEHSLPPLNDANVDAITTLLQYAGVLGASSDELRQMVNQIQGVELSIDDGQSGDTPTPGGPDDPAERQDQMDQFLQDQRDPPRSREEAMRRDWSPTADVDTDASDIEADALPDGGIRFGNIGGDPFGDTDTLDAFMDALQDAGADQVYLGDERWPDVSGIHDRPVIAIGLSADAARSVWESFEDDAVGLTGPNERSADASLSKRDALAALSRQAAAAGSFSEGDEVDTPAGVGVVVEVRTSNFTGPSGSEVDASDENPAYVVAVEDGAKVYREGDLSDGQIDVDVGDPVQDVQQNAEAMMVYFQPDFDPCDGTLEAGPTDFDYPPSWRKSSQPSRLILLKAWAGMNGQFDCGGDCCHGEMVSSGMSDRAANQFCAAMKDRVLQWEGWRKGGGSKADASSSGAVQNFLEHFGA